MEIKNKGSLGTGYPVRTGWCNRQKFYFAIALLM